MLRPLLVVLLAAAAAAAAAPRGASAAPARSVSLVADGAKSARRTFGNFELLYLPAPGIFKVTRRDMRKAGPVFAAPRGQAFLSLAAGPANPAASYQSAVYVLRATMVAQTDIQTVASVSVTGATATVTGALHWVTGDCSKTPAGKSCPPSTWTKAADYVLTFQATSDAKVEWSVSWTPTAAAKAAGPAGLNRLAVRFAASKGERFHGLGIQTSSWMHNGRAIPIYNLEPGIGKGEPATTILSDINSPGGGGSPFSAYSSIPHLLSSTHRSFVLDDSRLSVFDLTATDVPRLPLPCPTCNAGAAGYGVGVYIPSNTQQAWRCAKRGTVEYLDAIAGNDFMAMKFVFDVLQPLIQIDKAAAHDILSKLQPGGGNPGMHALLPAIRAWLLEKRPGWLDHLMAHLFAADLGSEIARLIEGGALLVNVTAVGGTPPACFQCAHEDCSTDLDASWIPLLPYTRDMRRNACPNTAGKLPSAKKAPGLVQSQVAVLAYLQPGDADRVTGFISQEGDMAAALELYTEYSGRMRPLPSWATQNGAIISITGRTENVLEKYNILKQGGVPMSALWVQDWPGMRLMGPGEERLWWNWQLDTSYYYNWTQLVDYLKQDDVRMTLYANPYLANDQYNNKSSIYYHYYKLYRSGLSNDAFLKCASNDSTPYISYSVSSSFSYAIVDLSDAAARDWFAAQLAENLYINASGIGYMCDFADQTPFDPAALTRDGRQVGSLRNKFPEWWAMTARAAMEMAGVGDEAVAWTRSASSRTPAHATLMWLGDQNPRWDAFDGLRSVLIGTLSAGLSGLTLVHSDTGSYTTASPWLVRTKELLLRWSEFNAVFDSVFRTHIGSDTNVWQVWDPDTPLYFGWLVRVHQALWPYRGPLLQEAYSRGLPPVRHPFWYFPSDPQVQSLQWQAMLGPYLMFCPVFESQQKAVDCYLPGRALDWFPVWGVTLPAPARGRDGSAKCPSGSSARACWVKAAAPLLPGGDPVTGDVTPEGCPAMFIRKSGLADAGVQAALGKLRQLAAASGGKCGGVLP